MWHDNATTSFADFLTSVSPSINNIDLSGESEYSNDTDFIGNNDSSPVLSYDKYCSNLQDIGSTYNKIHGIASIAVCLFGIVANILNFLILTRKEMINSTNAILTGLAVSDLLNLVEYVPYAIYTDFLPDALDGGTRKTYPWAVYVLIHSNFSQVCHTISIWLTVTIAAWRYFMISMPLQSRALCSMQRAKLMVALAYCITPILCVPIYFTFSVQTVLINPPNPTVTSAPPSSAESFNSYYYYNYTTTINSTFISTSTPLSPEKTVKYVVNLSNLSNRHPYLVKINFWIYSVVLKIIPCVLLTVVSFCLINSLLKAKKRKEMLLGPLSPSTTGAPSKSNKPPGCTFTASTIVPCINPPPPPTATIQRAPVIFTTHENETRNVSQDENLSGTITTASEMGSSASSKIPLQLLGASLQEALPMSPPFSKCSQNLTRRKYLTTAEIAPEIESELTSVCDETPRQPNTSRTSASSSSTGDMYLTSRTTRMLLTVLILFLITEFPQGILALFSAIIGQEFFRRCYIPMANMMDFLALVNCSINFILYCFMSKRFRDAFVRMLKRK